MSKKRELDSITPSFNLTDEQIADLRRISTDPKYAKEVRIQQEKNNAVRLSKLETMISTGKDENGNIIPPFVIKRLKIGYELTTGVKWEDRDVGDND